MSFTDLQEVLIKQFFEEAKTKTSVNRSLVDNGFSMPLSQLLNFNLNSSDQTIQKFQSALVLTRFQEECPKGVKCSKVLNHGLILLQIAPEHKEAIINCCDTILISELAEAKSTKEIIQWCSEGVLIQKHSENELDGMKIGYTIFEASMWNQASDIYLSPRAEKILDALKNLKSGQTTSEFSTLSTLILAIGRASLAYIEKRNNIDCMGNENIKRDVQEAHRIIQAIEQLKIEDDSFENDVKDLKEKLTGIELPNIQPVLDGDQKDFFIDYSTIGDEQIHIIDSSSVQKIDPPLYALKTTYFQVCIYKAIYNNGEVAIKMYQPVHAQADWNKIYKEIRIYQKLSSMASNQNCFLKYYGTYADQNSINMVMEYYPDNLMKYLTHLQSVNYRFTEELIGPIFCRLLSSFKLMKDVGVFHSDIKPHNFLVDQFWNIKIIDFSISMIKNEDITTTATGQFPIQGTDGYTAPEIEEARLNKEIRARFNPEKADVFSLGLVFLQMLTYENVKGFNTKLSHQSLVEKINTITIGWAQMLIKKMLELDTSNRYNFTQLLSMIPISATPSVNRT